MLEAFIEAQAEQKQCNVELSIFEDVYLVLWFKIREIWEWWPSKRRIIYLLSNEVASKNVAWWQLVHLNLHERRALRGDLLHDLLGVEDGL